MVSLGVAWINGPSNSKKGRFDVQNGQKVKEMNSITPKNPLKETFQEITVTELVRLNLNGLLSHYQGELEVNNAFTAAYLEYEKTGKNVSIIWKFTNRILNFEPKKRKIEELSLAKIAQGLQVDISVLRSIFEGARRKGSPEISVEEVVWMAKLLDVAPSYLLQPLRVHLENDVTLLFKSKGKFQFEVKAREWLLWVHSLRPLTGLSSRTFEESMMKLTPEPNARISSKRDIWPSDEMQRIGNALYSSPVSAVIHAQSEPIPGHLMSDSRPPIPHPLDVLQAGKTYLDRLHRRTRAALACMQHVRQVLRFTEEASEDRKFKLDVDWCLNRIREDLSLIYANRETQIGSKP